MGKGAGAVEQVNDVKLAQKGNKDAFVRLITAAEKSMYRVARAILKSDNECADAIQESILKAYKSMGGLREPQYFKTWLTKILINECNRILKNNRKIIPIEEYMDQAYTLDAYEKIEIQEAVSSLDDEFRVVVILFYFEDMTIKDIAQMLEIPEGTVKSRLSRARERLSKQLKIQSEGGSK
jgi:RNA polymerase sigma-70 factor (ECF subfamily)